MPEISPRYGEREASSWIYTSTCIILRNPDAGEADETKNTSYEERAEFWPKDFRLSGIETDSKG
jgi:hypothetical protein